MKYLCVPIFIEFRTYWNVLKTKNFYVKIENSSVYSL